jgi:hypothetical protein
MPARSLALFFALLALLPIPLRAEDGPGSGNGGQLVRIDAIAVRNMIYENCDHWITLQKAHVDCKVLRAKMDEVGIEKDKFLIAPTVTLDDGIERSGKNRPWIPDVTFSSSFWLAAKDDTAAKIGFVMHEFLGLLGIEKTDDSHISSALINELRSVTLVTDGNQNFLRTILEASQMIAKASSCKSGLSNAQRWDLFMAAGDKIQAFKKKNKLTAQEKEALDNKYDEAKMGFGTIAVDDLQNEPYCKGSVRKVS